MKISSACNLYLSICDEALWQPQVVHDADLLHLTCVFLGWDPLLLRSAVFAATLSMCDAASDEIEGQRAALPLRQHLRKLARTIVRKPTDATSA